MKPTKPQLQKICRKLNAKPINILLLGRGAHNENHLLDTDKGKFVLRICLNSSDRLKQEYEVLKRLKGKFGPKVYFLDDSKKILSKDYFIEDYIEGTNYPKLSKKLMRDIAKILRKLHNSSSKKVYKRDLIYKSLEEYFKDYLEEFNANKQVIKNKKLSKEIKELFDITNKICKNNDRIFSKRNKKVLIHGNIDPEHIVITKKEIKLIDWEFTRYGLLESDLTFFTHLYDLDKSQIRYFLDSYNYPKNKEKEFYLLLLLHHVGLINWALERIKEISQGKIYKDLKSSSYKEMDKEIKLHLRKSKEMLEELR